MNTRFRVVRRGYEQRLVKEYLLFGFPVLGHVEQIPTYAPLQIGCFGETDWKSKFAPFNEDGVKQ